MPIMLVCDAIHVSCWLQWLHPGPQNAAICRRRKRNIAAVSKTEPTAVVKQEPAAAEAPTTAAGSTSATGCRAAVSLAALAMQDSRPDAWLQALCNQHNAAESILSAQPLEAGHRHSSGGSEQSLARHTSFAQHLTAMPLEDLGNLDLSQEQTVPGFSGTGHNTVLSAVAKRQAATGANTVAAAVATCQAATGLPTWTGSNSTVRLELAPEHSCCMPGRIRSHSCTHMAREWFSSQAGAIYRAQ